jgi:hypothetical protein
LPRAFRGGPYAFDIVMDIGAYRDLHRHRRCHQFRQAYDGQLGYDTPPTVAAAGVTEIYDNAMRATFGDGSATLVIHTFSGDIIIAKR